MVLTSIQCTVLSCLKGRTACTVKVHAYASSVMQSNAANRVVEHQRAAAPAGIRGHHPDPVRVHVVSLPVHAHLDAAAAPGVVVPGHRCHLRLGMGDACVGHGNHLKGGGECLETVAVVAVLTHLVHDLGDDELSQRLAGEGPEGLVEGAVYLDDAAHTDPAHGSRR